MNIYTKGGDRGTTSLIHSKNLSKSDDRIELVGTVDELTSHLGRIKVRITDPHTREVLTKIQRTLITVMAGVADPYKKDYHIGDEETAMLEQEIDRMEALFARPKEFILPGEDPLSADIDVARTVCRRAERALARVSVKFGADNGSKKLLNRLADYLYVLARYQDALIRGEGAEGAAPLAGKEAQTINQRAGEENTGDEKMSERGQTGFSSEEEMLITQVIRRMNVQARISLRSAVKLIERIEQEAERRGAKAVVAVCGPDGNPVAVHAMDGAFLVSFNVALNKAYTSVAVKMSTMELSKIAQPGQTFYGVDKMDQGRICIFGGGIPIKIGETIIGGLGVSGGTGEEDHSLAEYGLSCLREIL